MHPMNIVGRLRTAMPTWFRLNGHSNFFVHRPWIHACGTFRKRHLSNGREDSTKATRVPGTQRGPITWMSVGLLAVVGGGIVHYWTSEQYSRVAIKQESQPGRGIGRPAIGGPFQLVDHNGVAKTDKDFLGKWLFIYFGFTYCPDICPNELMRMAQIITALDKRPDTAGKIAPLFITIDPERDGPKQLKAYLSDWHPRMIGLTAKLKEVTGTPENVADAGKKYRVYASKSKLGEGAGDYLVDHSIMFYLVDDHGQFVDYFGKSLSPEEIEDKIARYMSGTADETTHSDSSIGVRPSVVA